MNQKSYLSIFECITKTGLNLDKMFPKIYSVVHFNFRHNVMAFCIKYSNNLIYSLYVSRTF